MKNKHSEDAIRSLRHIPILVAFMMMVHIILLLCGISTSVAEIFEVCAGFYMTYKFSVAFRFCALHRHMIYYSYLVTVCIWLQRSFHLFGHYLTLARIVMLASGIILFVHLIVSRLRANNICPKR